MKSTILLYNLRARLVGINQTKNTYMSSTVLSSFLMTTIGRIVGLQLSPVCFAGGRSGNRKGIQLPMLLHCNKHSKHHLLKDLLVLAILFAPEPYVIASEPFVLFTTEVLFPVAIFNV
jgi:hypothetical protein